MGWKKFFKIDSKKSIFILIIFAVLFFIPNIPNYDCIEPGPCGYHLISLFLIATGAGLDDLFSFPIGISLILIEIVISYLIASIILYLKNK